MSRENLRKKLLQALAAVAPEAVDENIDDQVSLQDQLDLDSVDMLNYVVRIQKEFNIEIPNADYRKFLTLDAGIQQLSKMAVMA